MNFYSKKPISRFTEEREESETQVLLRITVQAIEDFSPICLSPRSFYYKPLNFLLLILRNGVVDTARGLPASCKCTGHTERRTIPCARGWSFQEFSGVKRNSFKGQILGLIYATQYLRVPLILLNLLCIVVKLVSGYACSTCQIILDQSMNLNLDISRGWALREEVSVKKCGEDSFRLSRSNLNLSRRIIYS
ncbi:hypothetical protein Sango_0702800 [Sesamum angolense]|uniref:Uncharacterized protein n=1 Tax=Sesamum angolense TaxID=2727404 RepID=A0AAE1X108_9LAMI|nr:hypothetical protein Sango_0702800 [Sesamum angolense]